MSVGSKGLPSCLAGEISTGFNSEVSSLLSGSSKEIVLMTRNCTLCSSVSYQNTSIRPSGRRRLGKRRDVFPLFRWSGILEDVRLVATVPSPLDHLKTAMAADCVALSQCQSWRYTLYSTAERKRNLLTGTNPRDFPEKHPHVSSDPQWFLFSGPH